ncbi:MAG: MFS transporter [Solimonas sp.]
MKAEIFAISNRTAWRSTWILVFAALLCSVDRTLPGVLTDPIRNGMGFSDTQMSLLVGMAFAISYGLSSFPMSWLADRYSRPRIITGGIVFWCLATLACGLAPDFSTLFVLRMGVGLGEAALVPAGLALLADLFTRERLPRAVAVISAGSALGIALAFPVATGLHELFETLARDHGWLAGIDAWRPTFVAVGLAGLLLALFTARLPEPRRGRAGRLQTADADAEGLFAYLRRSAAFTAPMLAGVMLFNFYLNGYLAWLAPYFTRTHGWTLAKTGQVLGVAVVGAGIVGSLCSGWLATALSHRRGRDSAMWVTALTVLLTLPLALLAPLMADAGWSLALTAAQLFFTFATWTVMTTALINAAPPHLRARFVAINMFAGGLLGVGLGPTIYALLTDRVFQDPAKLNLSLALGSALLLLPTLLVLARAAMRYHAALAQLLPPRAAGGAGSGP